nr:DUF1833 family protein [Desulfuromonas acetoxidans]
MTTAYKEAIAYANPETTIWEAIRITHSSWLESILLVNSYEVFTANLGSFIPVQWSMKLPEVEAETRGELTLKIDLLPLSIKRTLFSGASKTDAMKLYYYEYTDTTDPAGQLPAALEISKVEMDEDNQVTTIKALYADLVNIVFPRRRMTTTLIPGGLV